MAKRTGTGEPDGVQTARYESGDKYDESRQRIKAHLGSFDCPDGSKLDVSIKSYVSKDKDGQDKEGEDKISIVRTFTKKSGEVSPKKLGWLAFEEAQWLGGILSKVEAPSQ